MPNSDTWEFSRRWPPTEGIDLPNNDELELALCDQFPLPKEKNRLLSPSGLVDAQSESDHSDDDEQIPTALSVDEVEESDLPAPRTNSPPDEPPPLCEEHAKIIDQGLPRSPPSGQQHQSRPVKAEDSDSMQTR